MARFKTVITLWLLVALPFSDSFSIETTTLEPDTETTIDTTPSTTPTTSSTANIRSTNTTTTTENTESTTTTTTAPSTIPSTASTQSTSTTTTTDNTTPTTTTTSDTTTSTTTTAATTTSDHAQDTPPADGDVVEEVRKFLEEINTQGAKLCNKRALVVWDFSTNITEHNRKASVAARLEYSTWLKEVWIRAQKFKDSIYLLPEDLKRQLKEFSDIGSSALPEKLLEEYTNLKSEMTQIYSTAKTCDFNNNTLCDLSLSPELSELMSKSRNYEELSYVWQTWRDASGKKIRPLYPRLVELSNMAAGINGFDTVADQWLSNYGGNGTFVQDVENAYQQLVPLYKQMHAYVRRKLREVYGSEHVSLRGPIPASILGNMWAQSWAEIFDLLQPFPAKKFTDVTEEMKAQGYTPTRMFEAADDFYASLGFSRLPASFWKNSMIVKPQDREVVCHASAWDFCDGDVRVKMCTEVTMKDLQTVYHELGHIHYSMQYAHLPYVYRTGANRGFHEAIGDLLGMSAVTPKYLHQIGLLTELKEDQEADINFLLDMALKKVAFLPFAYLMDQWRWDTFNGNVPEAEWNCAWWRLRVELQGVYPPVQRTEADFDPAGKYHVVKGTSYLRYLVAHILQFQFHQALCEKAGRYNPEDPTKPLYKCHIYESPAAGEALRKMLRLGASIDWRDALLQITEGRTSEMDASAMREYFRPLEEWLTADNAKHGEFVGWDTDGQYCSSVQ